MEKIKKFFEIVKKALTKGCIIFLIMSCLFNINIYSQLQRQYSLYSNDNNVQIKVYEKKEEKIEEQIKEQKEEKGEAYPALTIMQNKRYIMGASSVAVMNFELALGSIMVGVIIEISNCIYKLLKNMIIKIKESKTGKKNEK